MLSILWRIGKDKESVMKILGLSKDGYRQLKFRTLKKLKQETSFKRFVIIWSNFSNHWISYHLDISDLQEMLYNMLLHIPKNLLPLQSIIHSNQKKMTDILVLTLTLLIAWGAYTLVGKDSNEKAKVY